MTWRMLDPMPDLKVIDGNLRDDYNISCQLDRDLNIHEFNNHTESDAHTCTESQLCDETGSCRLRGFRVRERTVCDRPIRAGAD